MEEFKLINYIKKKVKIYNKIINKGIGDDCAILDYNKENYLIITTDSLFENVHFKKEYFLPEEIGQKSVLVNISDIYAMGGLPIAALLNIGFPKNISENYIKKIIDGIINCLNRNKISLIGGDTISANKIFISITMIGCVEKKKIMKRNGAKPGDRIFITGLTGKSYAGYKILNTKGRYNLTKIEKSLIKAHLVPKVDKSKSMILANSGCVTSCIDISDGIMSDISRIIDESKVGAEIFLDNLSIPFYLKDIAKKYKEDVNDFVLYGGEDYELLFTINKDKIKRFNKYIKNKFKVFEIGRIIKERKLFKIENNKKIKEDFKKVWKHF